MAGFIRRFSDFPGNEQITQIEGVFIVDSPPPGRIEGIGVGVVGLVGEFSNMEQATAVDSTGNVSTNIRPVEVTGGQDLIDKVGGFDETLGQFGDADGNGYVKLRNKRFSRLVVAPVNLCSARAARFHRQLPLCTTATDTNAVVPVQPAVIEAGREFRSGTGRIRVGKRVVFTSRTPLATGVAGVTVNGASAATQTFNADAGFDWSTIERPDGSLGARVGDVLVVGYNSGGTATPAGEYGTYRVQVAPGSGIAVVVQRLDGANFAWTAQTGISWRLHFGTDADSAPERVSGSAGPGGYAFVTAGGYTVPIRPITDSSGAQTDGTFTASLLISPAVAPDSLTGASAEPLSGVAGILHPGGTTAFNVDLQGLNRTNHADLDAAYLTAIDAFEADESPVREVNLMVSARRSANIRAALRSHVINASKVGIGRIAVISPQLSTLALANAVADADPGVGGSRDESVIYSWPGFRHLVPEAVGYLIARADGTFSSDGMMDDAGDGWLVSVLSNLAPEKNPGQAADPVRTVMSPIRGIQSGVSGLTMNDYILLRSRGVAAGRFDRVAGYVFQSGITTSLLSGRKNINRRRMTNFIQDSVAARLVQFSKQVLTNQLKDGMAAEIDQFLNDLLSPNNPAQQRIAGYVIDEKSANTASSSAQGIYTIIGRVEMLATGDFIGFQTEVGLGVLNVTAA